LRLGTGAGKRHSFTSDNLAAPIEPEYHFSSAIAHRSPDKTAVRHLCARR
jgi:hypothetical protein